MSRNHVRPSERRAVPQVRFWRPSARRVSSGRVGKPQAAPRPSPLHPSSFSVSRVAVHTDGADAGRVIDEYASFLDALAPSALAQLRLQVEAACTPAPTSVSPVEKMEVDGEKEEEESSTEDEYAHERVSFVDALSPAELFALRRNVNKHLARYINQRRHTEEDTASDDSC